MDNVPTLEEEQSVEQLVDENSDVGGRDGLARAED